MSTAGTLESSDVLVSIEPGNGSVEIELKSTVDKQFGKQIRHVIASTLEELGLSNVKLVANDRGALDCTIKARVLAAAYRAAESTDFKWGE